MNRRQRKKNDRKILESGDLSYCRHCGNANIWHVFKKDSTVYAMFCTKCGWKCGNVPLGAIKQAREEEQKIKEVQEAEYERVEINIEWK